jgi:hypothetical protein
LANLVIAEDVPERKWEKPNEKHAMPPGEIITVDGDSMRCYTLHEGKIISRLVNDYNDLFNQAIRWKFIRLEYEAKVAGLEIQLKASEGLASEYKNNAEWYRKLWKSTRNEFYLDSKFERWRWLPWFLPALMGAAWGITSAVK